MCRIERQVKRLVAMVLLLCAYSVTSYANGLAPKSIRIFPEIQGFWFLDGKLPFGCEVTYTNGGKRRTSGYLNGNLPWRELVCESDQAIFHGDEILVDLFKVKQNNNTLVIRVRMRNFALVKSEFEIKIPPVEAVRVMLPEDFEPHYGRTIEPYIQIDWSNGARYTYKSDDVRALVPRDSVELYFNNTRIFDGRVHLPEFTRLESHTFALSVVWASKPWLNYSEVYPFIGKQHEVWTFDAEDGANGGRQAAAPAGMEGAEGFHGEPGSDAPEVKVLIYFNETKTKLIVEATNGNQAFRDFFSPDQFSLEIEAKGGNGGDGGRGGEGGRSPINDPYMAGIGGRGGRGGKGGKGAKVSIESGPETEEFIPCIIVDNSDGAPGKPGQGGKGGVFAGGYGVPTLLELFFPSRNYDGEPGEE
jgi:hypothetical protein